MDVNLNLFCIRFLSGFFWLNKPELLHECRRPEIPQNRLPLNPEIVTITKFYIYGKKMEKRTGFLESLFISKKKQGTIKSLTCENKTLHSILNNLTEGVVVADKNGNFLFFNPVAEKILGIGQKNISSAEWSTVYGTFYPDKSSVYPSQELPLARAIRGEEVLNEPIFIRNRERPEGVLIEVSGRPLKDENDNIAGGTVIIRDISKIKEVELLQKQSEERVKAQFKGFPIPTYVWQYIDNDFILVDYNNVAEQFTQSVIQNFINKSIREIYADLPEIQTDFWRCYTEQTVITREISNYRLRTRNENKEMIFSYVFLPPDLIMLHTEDITERKNHLEALKKLSNVVKQTADSVVITNPLGIIEYVNPAFELTTGYQIEEVIGKSPKILKSGEHDQAFYENIWNTILSGNTYRGGIINRKKNGELYWSVQTITPMKDDNGNITNFVSVLKDVTEIKQKHDQEFQLKIAREIQQCLMKANYSIPGFDIAGATYSASETNGDYIDFITMPDGCIGMIIGDVSGHGLGAALLMATTRGYLRAFARNESDPAILLTKLNDELMGDLSDGLFVTMVFARLNPHDNTLDYASAGHPPAFLISQSGEIKYEMKSTGIPLGVIKDYQYQKSDRIKLESDDTLFFLTDGVFEARSDQKIDFGVERALDLIKTNQPTSARQLLDLLFQNIRSFSENKPQEDDITLLLCKVKSEK